MIISGGVNVYPAEIEAELLQHPGVRDAAVVGVDDPTWGEVGHRLRRALARGSAEARRALDFLAERLAKYKLPKEIVHLDALPRTAYGKVVKGELKRRYLSDRAGMPRPRARRSANDRHPRLLAHRIEGEGPPVVLLNGGMMTFPSWEAVAAPLRARYRLLRFDFRGQLLSPPATSDAVPSDLAGHAADLAALLDRARLGVGPPRRRLVRRRGGARARRRPARARSLPGRDHRHGPRDDGVPPRQRRDARAPRPSAQPAGTGRCSTTCSSPASTPPATAAPRRRRSPPAAPRSICCRAPGSTASIACSPRSTASTSRRGSAGCAAPPSSARGRRPDHGRGRARVRSPRRSAPRSPSTPPPATPWWWRTPPGCPRLLDEFLDGLEGTQP